MPLKPIITADEYDRLPESERELYAESDDGYVLECHEPPAVRAFRGYGYKAINKPDSDTSTAPGESFEDKVAAMTAETGFSGEESAYLIRLDQALDKGITYVGPIPESFVSIPLEDIMRRKMSKTGFLTMLERWGLDDLWAWARRRTQR